MSILKEYIGELLLEDSRGNIKKLGFSSDAANFFHDLDPKHSYWLAKSFFSYANRPDMLQSIKKPYSKQETRILFRMGNGKKLLSILEKSKKLGVNPTEVPAIEMAEQSEVSGDILMTFPDGSYWIDLNSGSCAYEEKMMGHCGKDLSGGTLVSLRDKRRKPHVTMTLRSNVITQAKGKENNKPVKKYHKYITKLIVELDLDIETTNDDDLKAEDFTLNELNWIIGQASPEIAKHYKKALKEKTLKPYKEWVNKFINPAYVSIQSVLKNLLKMNEDDPMFSEVSARDFYDFITALSIDLSRYRSYLLGLEWNSYNSDRLTQDEAKANAEKTLSVYEEFMKIYGKQLS